MNIIWNYQEIKPDQIIDLIDQPKETIIQVNYNLNTETKESTVGLDNELHLELNDECQSLSDIINNHDSDIESKNLIESIMARDKEEHAGTDEATICLVQQLQKDCEDEVKQQEPEPFKFHDDEFPPLK